MEAVVKERVKKVMPGSAENGTELKFCSCSHEPESQIIGAFDCDGKALKKKKEEEERIPYSAHLSCCVIADLGARGTLNSSLYHFDTKV